MDQIIVSPITNGGWEVRILRRTRADACRSAARLHAPHEPPCELIIRDAYQRVAQREVLGEVRAPDGRV
jgi:hypothetical protein